MGVKIRKDGSWITLSEGTQGTEGTQGAQGTTGTATQGTGGVRGGSDWTPNLTNVTQSSTDSMTFTKTGGTDGSWDSQVYSSQGFVRGAYASARISSTSGSAVFGLNSDPTTDASYTSVDYAFFFSNGSVAIYESGTLVYASGTYTTGDTAYVIYDGSNVRYYLNGTLLRTVSRTIGSALYLDSSIRTSNLAFNQLAFGPMGEIGTQGTQGTQGTTGTATQGATGTATQGTQGTQGTTGTATQGTQGTEGAQGTAGTGGTGSVTNDTSSTSNRYVTYVDVTSGTPTATYVSSTKLIFKPSTGNLSATSFTSLSDVNKKENITKIDNAIEILLQLEGVRFNWKDTHKPSLGVIAQDVEKILPELVETSDDGTKSVSYGNIIGVLIEAIKEQQKQIDELKRR